MFGFLNINKARGITSHKVISVLRKITGIKQIGHSGTLDPLATGVLPIAIGKASKLIDYLPQEKAYRVTMCLGYISDTYDNEGDIKRYSDKIPDLKEIEEVKKSFIGEIKQIPPVFSAVHYKGKRLYELARKGDIPNDIPQRDITIYRNEIISFDSEQNTLTLDIECSKGTYIRSIVNDIGKMLNTGAIMTDLTRIKSSGMCIEDSLNITDETDPDFIKNHIINPQNIIKMPTLEVNEEEYKILLNGNKFKNRTSLNGDLLLIKDEKIIAIANAKEDIIQPKKVLI